MEPESGSSYEDGYGPASMCWTSPSFAAGCRESCKMTLEALNTIAEITGEPTCGTCTSAADCDEFGPLARCEAGLCETQSTGEATINCAGIPIAERGVPYSHAMGVLHGSGDYQSWAAQGLPSGLTIGSKTGVISGTPSSAPATHDVVISVHDALANQTTSSTCQLTVNAEFGGSLATLDPPCIDASTSAEDLDAILGGDGSAITCRLDQSGPATCPLGVGNGRLPPGITFDESSCTHQGSLASTRQGTWVWIVELEQSGNVIHVPFCAVNDVPSFHTIALTVDGATRDPLEPTRHEYDPSADLAFGMGSHQWDIGSPDCPGPECSNYGVAFDVTCSPFSVSAPYQITLAPSSGTSTGLFHQMTATGPAPGDSFRGRPFVASFEMSYCTSSAAVCDTSNPTLFEQNAQTQLHFDVIGWPIEP